MVSSVLFSIPLVAETTARGKLGDCERSLRAMETCSATSLNPWEGTTKRRISLSETAFEISEVISSAAGRLIPGRYEVFSLPLRICSANSRSLAQRTVSTPLSARRTASVVPQLPAPNTPTRLILRLVQPVSPLPQGDLLSGCE